MRNPQMYQMYQKIKENNQNPQEILKQMTDNYNSEQMKDFEKFVNQFGITNEQLNQYGINTNK